MSRSHDLSALGNNNNNLFLKCAFIKILNAHYNGITNYKENVHINLCSKNPDIERPES